VNTSDTVNADPRLKPLYRIGGAAALFAGAIYLVHLIVFFVRKRQRLCLQEYLEEGGVDSQELQCACEGDLPQEQLVREQAHPEERLVARADGHHMAQLGESQGGEDHRLLDFGRNL
jgi:hypothetical protein